MTRTTAVERSFMTLPCLNRDDKVISLNTSQALYCDSCSVHCINCKLNTNLTLTMGNSKPLRGAVTELPPSEVSSLPKKVWYRRVFFQATVVGLCAFLAPGLYNAMQSTGAGGQQTPYLVMAANSVLGVMMVITCALGSVVANRIGLKNALIFGTTGYCIYAASLYTNNRYGVEWFVYLGAAACGITAGIFWAAEGAIMISCEYPSVPTAVPN